jgi:hypothetical protein
VYAATKDDPKTLNEIFEQKKCRDRKSEKEAISAVRNYIAELRTAQRETGAKAISQTNKEARQQEQVQFRNPHQINNESVISLGMTIRA